MSPVANAGSSRDVMKLMSVANVSMHASMPKEDILAFNMTQEYTHN